MYFQTIDDKEQCIGIYTDGELLFEDTLEEDLTRTWKHSSTLNEKDIEYGWLYVGGKTLEETCPQDLQEDYAKVSSKLRAYRKSFELAKIDLNEHCFFDLVPHDFLVRFLEVKNRITRHVFETYDKPAHYEHLKDAHKLLQKIRYQKLNLNSEDCREIFVKSRLRHDAQKYLNRSNYIDYNLFGTVTGRLTTRPHSFPILTINKQLRKLVKPRNDWFLSLDYNGAEVRTLLALSGMEQPEEDIHEWNLTNVIKRSDMHREEAKNVFFGWLYNPESKVINTQHYDRKKVLDEWYDGVYISTPFERKIEVESRKAFNYLIQSTTSDLVLERAVAIDKFLEGKESFISHIVHDEIVIDLSNEERHLAIDIKEIFSQNKLGTFLVNMAAGNNYLDLNELTL